MKKNEELEVFMLNSVSAIVFLKEDKKRLMTERDSVLDKYATPQCKIENNASSLNNYLNKSNTTLMYFYRKDQGR